MKPSIRLEQEKIITANGETVLGKRALPIDILILGRKKSISPIILPSLTFKMIVGLDIIRPLIKEMGLDALFQINSLDKHNICVSSSDFREVMKDKIIASIPTKLPTFRINTGNSGPSAISRFRIGKPAEDEIEEKVKELEEAGIVRKSISPWSSPALLVPKSDGTKRLCIDYRKLNEVTVKDAYPLPRIDDILDNLAEASVFSTLDATSGYYQIPIAEDSIEKTAFQTRSGLYEFTRMPFGLSNAPAAFQRTMDEIFREERGKFVQIYLDDIIIYSKSKSEHEKHLELVLDKIKSAGLSLKKEKCIFSQDELTILGYVVRKNEVKPSPRRADDIRDFPLPNTVADLRSFLGLLNYCSNFIENLASKTSPLLALLKGTPPMTSKILLTKDQVECFENLKEILKSDLKLAIPNYNKAFIVTTDASSMGLSGILAQKDDNGVEAPVAFFSKKTSESQAKYSATQLELLAVVETLKHFRHYLIHKRFLLKTDHQALLALKHSKNQNSMLFRWSLFLSEFDFEVQYIKGEHNPADALSRAEYGSLCSIQQPGKQIILDKLLQTNILEQYHKQLGHGCVSNMIYNLKKKYYWKGMYTQVKEYVSSCQVCLRAQGSIPNTNFKMLTSTFPGELIELDTIGPIPCSSTGKKFIITAIDHFSKFACAVAVPNKNAEFVSKFLAEIIIPTFPFAKTFLSDNGLEFKSAMTIQTAEKQGIRWKFGSPYHPETQGAVERLNGTLLNKLAKLSKFKYGWWDRCLPEAVYACNSSFHRAIGCSPFELFSGELPIFEIDKSIFEDTSKWTVPKRNLVKRREEIQRQYKSEFEGSAAAPNNFEPGDTVLRYDCTPNLPKLSSRWEPGFRIKRINPASESFILEKNGKAYVANKVHIKLDTSTLSNKNEGG